ncbi:MAG: outer membrane biosynthesis protein TonB [Pseudoalteromonas distincta]|jgi:outer membrane biosynthesis protein TonB
MSDHDRGAYTPPTDAPLSFDARQPVRGSRPAPMMLLISAVVLVVLVVAIVLIYRSGAREAGDPPQTVGTPVGEMKTAPAPEDQPVDPATGLQIYRSEDGAPAPAEPNFVPPPEQPQARPDPQLRPSAPVTSQPAPAAQPAPTPTPKAPAQTTPAAPPAKAPAPAAVASGGAMVQVGAFSSEALADAGWNDAMRALPDSAAGKGKRVEPVESNGKTLYRGYVTGFSSRAEASAYCDRLKAAGRSCFVR